MFELTEWASQQARRADSAEQTLKAVLAHYNQPVQGVPGLARRPQMAPVATSAPPDLAARSEPAQRRQAGPALNQARQRQRRLLVATTAVLLVGATAVLIASPEPSEANAVTSADTEAALMLTPSEARIGDSRDGSHHGASGGSARRSG